MKTKIFCLLGALICAIAMLASCGGNPPGPGPNGGDGDYNWNKTTLIFELSENTSNGELSSEVKRYFAGEYFGTAQDIDDLVEERNELAESTTNVKIQYDYTPKDTEEFGWGSNVVRINNLVFSGAAAKPDMYCNFAYDLTCSALKGSFANLYSTEYGEGNNYFRFTKDDYNPVSDNFFDSAAGEGYFFDYMKSLALSDDKMYCLASDYCTDLVRAFLIVPVNVNMMNSIAVEDSTGDLTGDGDFTIADFYALVWGDSESGRAPGFTYDAVAKLAEAVYSDENGTKTPDYGDKLGFAAGVGSGLTGSGLLYTTSVKIITNTPHTANGKTYNFSYPEDNEDLGVFADALNNLFTKTGVVTVDAAEAKAVNSSYKSELDGIRHSFAENNILFGGVIAVGSLEDTVYQEMKAGDGFGVAPVPLYKAGDEYLTLVHNIARIVAISATTTKFEQCTAFLNYQSTNSSEIINEYYTNQLTKSVDGGLAGEDNVKMLTYIRNHVRDCFDKTYEDAISRYMLSSDTDAMNKRWHHILGEGDFRVTNIRAQYKSIYASKQGDLEEIIDEWNKLN